MNLFDDWFDDFPFFDDRDLRKVDKKLYGRRAGNLMKTDIQEMKDGYKMEVDLPGFKKDEITVELDDGYLTISAAKGLDQDEKEKESNQSSNKFSPKILGVNISHLSFSTSYLPSADTLMLFPCFFGTGMFWELIELISCSPFVPLLCSDYVIAPFISTVKC